MTQQCTSKETVDQAIKKPMQTGVKTRFCPSPTGLMHMGNARTALFNYLWALCHGKQGVFLLRIEDTDVNRSDAQYTESVQTDLEWLGMHWQEGPYFQQPEKGEKGPYCQSQRQHIYDTFYQVLVEKGMAYPCFCTETQLSISRKQQRRQGRAPRYMGGCDRLTDAQKEEKYQKGLAPTLRFRVPRGEVVRFEDGVKQAQRFDTDDLGDFVIRRADGTAPFLFCNAVDDALMGVSCVMRGEDHLTNTPRQLLILSALSLPVPQYVHMGLILGQDGAPLSKRNGSQSMASLRSQGYLPLAVVNYLSRVGHVMKGEGAEDLLSLSLLAQAFSVASLSPSPSKFDINQLHHWQKLAVMRLSPRQAWEWMASAVSEWVPDTQREAFACVMQENVLFPADAAFWARQLYGQAGVSYSSAVQPVLYQAGVAYFDAALVALTTYANKGYADWSAALRQQLGLSGKAFFAPLRVALTGQLRGPQLDVVWRLLEENANGGVKARLEWARDFVAKAIHVNE